MLRVSVLLILIAFSSLTGSAQTKSIDQKETERILRALTADDKGGRPAIDAKVMERSIVVIENEFKRIGLVPLDGLKSFRQEFTQDLISDTQLQLVANQKDITQKNAFVYSSEEVLIVNEKTTVQRIGKRDNPSQLIRRFLQDTTRAIVLVDTAHTKVFKLIQHRFAGKRILNATSKAGSKVFVLTSDTVLTSVSGRITQVKGKLLLTNVVGQIKADKKTDQSIVFSGHYDHLGIQPAVAGDSIANGADDDASGTTAVIMLADYFKKQKGVKRNLIFVAFTAEEVGGYGARYFSTSLDPEKVVAMFNIEMIGKLSKWGANNAFITGFERSDFGTILQRNLKGTAYVFNPDPYPAQNLFYRSDNATLARLGVPAHTISTDQIDTDKLYHTVDDEFESIDLQNMTEVIRSIAASALSLVNGKDTPTRIDKSKVD